MELWVWKCFKLMFLLACFSGRVVSFLPITNITHRKITSQWPASHRVCSGGAQVNILDESAILISLCVRYGPALGSIVTLPINNLAGVPTTLYGNSIDQISGFSPASVDGYNTSARFKYAHHMYQTTEGKTIYFVDNFSCLREINQTSGYTKTIIGSCGTDTLDWSTQLATSRGWAYVRSGVVAMTYYEKGKTWIFGIKYNGLFAYVYDKEANAYIGRKLLEMVERSGDPTQSFLLIRGDIIWYKFELDISRLDVSDFTENGVGRLNRSDGSFQIRLSASSPPTNGAAHTPGTIGNNILKLYSSLDMIKTDPYTIAINSYYSVDFYNPVRGNIVALCSDQSSVSCELNGINEIVWISETKLLGFDTDDSKIEEFVWPEMSTTTASTPETPTPRVSSPSTVASNVATQRMTNLSNTSRICALLQFGFFLKHGMVI